MTSSHPPRARFGLRFSLLARRWRQTLDACLAQAGLTDATWIPLVHLAETGGGITQKHLAQLVGIDASSLVRVLDIHARRGLIERRADETDGRNRLIFLTPAGETKVAEIRRLIEAAETRMLTDIADEDLDRMLEHFESIDDRLSELSKDGKGEGHD